MAQDMERTPVEDYYREMNPVKRGAILARLLGEDPGEENRIRKELYDLRYPEKYRRNDGNPADRYMNLWIMMKISAANSSGFFGKKSIRRDLKKLLGQLDIPGYMNRGQLEKELLYRELYHLAALYIESSRTDRKYGSGIMGLMPLKDDQVLGKITNDVYTVAYRVPENVDMKEEFSLLTKAAVNAFCDILPECRESLEQMIGK